MANQSSVLRLKPLQYAHILDLNSNVTYPEAGPKTLILQENHKIVLDATPFVIVPPGHYCIVENPVKLPIVQNEQCMLNFGQQEIRLHKEPFFLYPGEFIIGASIKNHALGIKRLPSIAAKHGLKLRALSDFEDGDTTRVSGEEWQLTGPLTYYPTPEVQMLGIVEPVIIPSNQALRLIAKQDLIDSKGSQKLTGEEWIVREPGAYLPGIYEEVVQPEVGYILNQKNALHMIAADNCVDTLGKKRHAGEEWLVTHKEAIHYIPEVGEELVEEIQQTVLSKHEYCVIVNPVDVNGNLQLGKRLLKTGLDAFFLHPGESFEHGIEKAYILNDDEALVLRARYIYTESIGKESIERGPGDKWMIFGPLEYVPPVEVKVECLRRATPLRDNDGIYVQDIRTGKIRSEMGPQSYLLKEHEVLWKKELPEIVELMLSNGGCYGQGEIRKLAYFESSVDAEFVDGKRDKTKVVCYRCPGNSAVQVYDFCKNTSRVIFGPDMVILDPHENFNVLSLSAGKPKIKDALKSLALMLGPDFITDIIEVETTDHARLRIKYAVNNKFVVDKQSEESVQKLFSVPDFIGFTCNCIASRIRGRVARTAFDEFHRYSTRIVKEAVFGLDKDEKPKSTLMFPENNMLITNIDVQTIEPVDIQMRDSLLKSVQLAIEISTQSIERAATQEAAREDQTAKGSLERSKLNNEMAAEKSKCHLYELRAITAAVESSGQAKAEAAASAEKLLIEGRSAIELATLKAEAEDIDASATLTSLIEERESQIKHQQTLNDLDMERQKLLTQIEVSKFSTMVKSIGHETIVAVATAGPDVKNKILKGLGMETSIFTDENSPINMFNNKYEPSSFGSTSSLQFK